MSAPILTIAAAAMCPHGGPVTLPVSAQRVLVNGAPALTLGALGLVQGCAVPPPGSCVTAQWQAGAGRVLAEGRPVLLQTSPSLCRSAAGAATGPVILGAGNMRVLAL